MNKKLFDEVTAWQKQTFPQSTSQSKLTHLQEEIMELSLEIGFDGEGKRHEFADCFFLLMGAAANEGYNYTDICDLIAEKLAINKERKWGEPDANGVVKHIEKKEKYLAIYKNAKLGHLEYDSLEKARQFFREQAKYGIVIDVAIVKQETKEIVYYSNFYSKDIVEQFVDEYLSFIE